MRKTRRYPRLTLWMMMAVIALAGVAFGAERLRGRSRYFAQRAEHCAQLQARPRLGFCGNAAIPGEEIHLRIAYFAAMKQKYEDLARSPWRIEGPDPPAPDALSGAMTGLTSADDW